MQKRRCRAQRAGQRRFIRIGTRANKFHSSMSPLDRSPIGPFVLANVGSFVSFLLSEKILWTEEKEREKNEPREEKYIEIKQMQSDNERKQQQQQQ